MIANPNQITALDLDKIRADFPILNQKVNGQPLIYLDSAASTQKPECVINAVSQYYLQDHSNVHRGIHELSNRATLAFENARKRVARFFNAPSEENVVFTRGTTEAINLVSQTWGQDQIQEGDVILLTEMEHHSNLVPWQLLTEKKGAQLEFIPLLPETLELDLSFLKKRLQENKASPHKIKLLCLTHISNTLGITNPVKAICALAQEENIITLVDGAQSAGHLPVDFQEINCDFYAFSGHKVAGPTGIGALIAKESLLETMPPWHGGGEMIDTADYTKSTWKTGPHKFEAGTPNIADAIGLHVALDYIDDLGRESIHQHDLELAGYAYQKMNELEHIQILGPKNNRTGMVTFIFDDIHAHDVVEVANQYGVALRGGHHCNQPLMKKLGTPATARASFYLYNTIDEIDQLIQVLKKVRSFFT
ncbi:MAG: cysteine desulfurase [Verrucomicrobiota bacterium]